LKRICNVHGRHLISLNFPPRNWKAYYAYSWRVGGKLHLQQQQTIGMFFLYPSRCLNFFSLLFFWSATRRKTKLGVLVFHPRYYSVMYMFCLRFWSSCKLFESICELRRVTTSWVSLSFGKIKGIGIFSTAPFLSNR